MRHIFHFPLVQKSGYVYVWPHLLLSVIVDVYMSLSLFIHLNGKLRRSSCKSFVMG